MRWTAGARAAAAAALLLALLLAPVAPAAARAGRGRTHARAAIAGGSEITIAQAPWQVEIEVTTHEGHSRCGGAILSATEVVTAAHCLFEPESETGLPVEAAAVQVFAGTSDYKHEPVPAVAAKALVIHPYYRHTLQLPTPDDVALIELAAPLTLGPDIAAIPLAGAAPAEGAAVSTTGFGKQSPDQNEASGRLYRLALIAGYSRSCGGEYDAVLLCASSGAGSVCFGDSGSGLTTPGAEPLLLGVTDTLDAESEICGAGTLDGFVNLAAPEIADFLAGSEAPPVAPNGGKAEIYGVLRTGHALTCMPGSWSVRFGGEIPQYTYGFIDEASRSVLQRGRSQSYLLTSADVGRSIGCEVWASTAGGTGVGRTEALGPIAPEEPPPLPVTVGGSQGGGSSSASGPAPAPASSVAGAEAHSAGETSAVTLASTRVSLGHGLRTMLVRLRCSGAAPCRGTLRLLLPRRSHGMVALGATTFAIRAGSTSTLVVPVAAGARALLAGHLSLAGRAWLRGSATQPLAAVLDSVELSQVRRRAGGR